MRRRVSILLASLAGAAGCSSEGPPRPQLVVSVDVDLPVPDQLATRPDLSGDAAIDTLRVDAIATDGSNRAYDLRTFLAPAPDDWPVSFGVAAEEAAPGDKVRLRLRAFRGRLGAAGELAGIATLDPPAGVAIDRLVDLDPPAEGVRRVRVTLRGDCLGVKSSFLDPPTTCLDAARRAGSPSDHIVDAVDDEGRSALVGTWPIAGEAPCSGPAPEGAVCVPGGFTILGEPAFEGVGDGVTTANSVPLVPARLHPFFMDRTEVTVKTLRDLVTSGDYTGTLPFTAGNPQVTFGQYCTWLGAAQSANDALPVNCVPYAAAAAICEARKGKLPSEAQWEHAARGRGQRRLYPWGYATADCCLTSASRKGPPTIPAQCAGSGIEPVGSHPASAACGGLGDESIDGVLDLAGSLTEALLDAFKPFDASCWQEPGGILVNPVCSDDTIARSARGGYWNGGVVATASPFRYSYTPSSPTSGFRCVYPASGAP